MKEADYVKASNLARLRSVQSISSAVLAGKSYGVDSRDLAKLNRLLRVMEQQCSDFTEIENND